MPNRVKNGFRPSVSNWVLSFSHAILPARAARQAPLDVVRLWIGCVPEHHHCVANELVDCSAFGEESLCKHGEIPRGLVHEHVGVRAGAGNLNKTISGISA